MRLSPFRPCMHSIPGGAFVMRSCMRCFYRVSVCICVLLPRRGCGRDRVLMGRTDLNRERGTPAYDFCAKRVPILIISGRSVSSCAHVYAKGRAYVGATPQCGSKLNSHARGTRFLPANGHFLHEHPYPPHTHHTDSPQSYLYVALSTYSLPLRVRRATYPGTEYTPWGYAKLGPPKNTCKQGVFFEYSLSSTTHASGNAPTISRQPACIAKSHELLA